MISFFCLLFRETNHGLWGFGRGISMDELENMYFVRFTESFGFRAARVRIRRIARFRS